MVAKNISSVQNPLIKHFCKIRINRKYRLENSLVLLVGRKEIQEVEKKIKPLYFIVLDEEKESNIPNTIYCTKEVLAKVSGLKNPEPCAIFPMPKKEDFSNKKALLVLDHIQDPGNMGTLLRSALALNFEGAILINTVDPFNDKALRASKGAALFLPFIFLKEEETIVLSKDKNVYIADIKGKPCDKQEYAKPFVLVLGHETKGPGAWTKSFTKITIPMNTKSESLNVSAAGAILMYEINKNA